MVDTTFKSRYSNILSRVHSLFFGILAIIHSAQRNGLALRSNRLILFLLAATKSRDNWLKTVKDIFCFTSIDSIE